MAWGSPRRAPPAATPTDEPRPPTRARRPRPPTRPRLVGRPRRRQPRRRRPHRPTPRRATPPRRSQIHRRRTLRTLRPRSSRPPHRRRTPRRRPSLARLLAGARTAPVDPRDQLAGQPMNRGLTLELDHQARAHATALEATGKLPPRFVDEHYPLTRNEQLELARLRAALNAATDAATYVALARGETVPADRLNPRLTRRYLTRTQQR